MPRKPAQEQGDTLVNIEQQAFQLFGRYGYEGVSIGDIAKRTKLSKGALYWHFPGKEALFLRCQQKIHALFNERIFLPMQAETRPGLGMLRLFEGLEVLLRDPLIKGGVTGYWLIPSTPETGDIAAAQRAFEQAAIATVRESLMRGQTAGLFDLGTDLDVMSRAIISIVEAVILPLRDQSADEVHRILAVLAKTLFRAYGGDGALALLDRFTLTPDMNLHRS
jgi:TetR/AcrR family transcriptional regulator, acrAB operon repressor